MVLRAVLFLGAGASKPFGIPTMKELTDYVLNNLNDEHKTCIENIRNRLENINKEKIDIEAILECVDGLCDLEISKRKLGKFAEYLLTFEDPLLGIKHEIYKEISGEIRKMIREECFLTQDIDTLTLLYDKIFDDKCLGRIKAAKINLQKPYKNLIDVFTTNYDLCFERYCDERRKDISDGFKNEYYINEFQEDMMKFIKIHGSTNYSVQENGRIRKSDKAINIGEVSIKGTAQSEVMIYPTTEKYLSKEPFFSMLIKFKDSISAPNEEDRIIIVFIGYSFRDSVINNIILDSIKLYGNRIRLIVLDPNAKQIIKNNLCVKESINVVAIEKEFSRENEEWYNELHPVINNQMKN